MTHRKGSECPQPSEVQLGSQVTGGWGWLVHQLAANRIAPYMGQEERLSSSRRLCQPSFNVLLEHHD